MPADLYPNVIVGTGEAGKYLAWHLGKIGQRAVVVERSLLGGACPNVACLPSKNVAYSAKVASLLSRAPEFGVPGGAARLDMAAVFRRKQAMVDDLARLHRDRFAASGVELLRGEARFTGPLTLSVRLNDGEGVREIRGERVFLNVGTRAGLPDVPGLADARPLTHVEALDLQRLPDHLIVLGGGYVGLEFAQAMRRFGSHVTIVHNGPRLLEREDEDVSDALLQLMRDEKIDVRLGAGVARVSGRSGEGVEVELSSPGGGGRVVVAGSDLLVATGRTPNTDRLDPAAGGVALDARGYIRVDDALRTTAPDVWAMGDCAGSPHFTHVSYDDFRVVRDALAGHPRTTRDRLIPYCLFTDPELAHVGLSEAAALLRGIRYRLAKLPFAAVLRTWTLGEKRGFMKVLVGDDDRVLGFTAFGAEASELLAAMQTAILGRVPYPALREAIFTHPTIAEGFGALFAAVPPLRPAAG